MRIRIAAAVLLTVALGVAAVLAWPSLRNTPEASAQQVVDACEKLEVSSYFDVLISGVSKSLDGQDIISGEIKISVAGTNFHYAEYEDGVGLGLEVILLDGVGYLRSEGVPWEETKDLDGGFVARDTLVAFTEQGWTLCPDFPDIVEKVGQVDLDGAAVTLYRASYEVDIPIYETKYAIQMVREYWLDTTGQLVQTREEMTYPDDSGKDIEGRVITKVAQIGGVGEPNTITAPALPPSGVIHCKTQSVTTYFDIEVSHYVSGEIAKARFSIAGTDFSFQGQTRVGEQIRDLHGIYIDGVGYTRYDAEPWRRDDSLTPDFVGLHSGLSAYEEGWSLCPDLDFLEEMGREWRSAGETTRYRWNTKEELSPGEVISIQFDYWVDETGLIVETRETPYNPTTMVAIPWFNKIGGVGEPNTITAPTIP